MDSLGSLIKNLRTEREVSLSTLSAVLEVDQAVLKKVERGEHRLNRDQVIRLAEYFHVDKDNLLVVWLSDKSVYELQDEDPDLHTVKAAEEKMSYRPSGTEPAAILEKIRETLTNDSRVAEAWLFGSYARGEQSAGSDIDLMLKFAEDRRVSLFDLADITYSLQSSTNRKIDLVEIGCMQLFAWETAQKDLIKVYG